MISSIMDLNWIYFFLAGIALMLSGHALRWLGIFNVLSVFTLIFIGNTFLPHYIVIASVGISLSIGVGLNSLALSRWGKATFLTFYLLLTYAVCGDHLKYYLVEAESPEFFYVAHMVNQLPEPVLTLEPIYAVFAEKMITPFYMMADPRYYDVINTTLPDALQSALISDSQTILLDHHTRALLSYDTILRIQATHQLVGSLENVEIWSVQH